MPKTPRLINDPDGFNDAGDCILIREDALHVPGDCLACDSYRGRECDAEYDAARCADCGAEGETVGHMGCQYPQDHE